MNSGYYVSIRGLFDLEVPKGWVLVSDDEGIANFSSPSRKAAVTVSAAQHRDPAAVVSACEHLRRYAKGLDIPPGVFREIRCSIDLAIGEYLDKAGIYWQVMFKASKNIVVLATYNQESIEHRQSEDAEAKAIFTSIRIRTSWVEQSEA
jgi:hypothetical protein